MDRKNFGWLAVFLSSFESDCLFLISLKDNHGFQKSDPGKRAENREKVP
jgi:hypothetical protein